MIKKEWIIKTTCKIANLLIVVFTYLCWCTGSKVIHATCDC
jgi:hypothetical protein